MTETGSVRIDKFLWAVRLYKTRSLASDACRMGRVLISNTQVKPSRSVSAGEMVTVKKPPATFTYRIKSVTENRLPAKLVGEFLDDLTPENEKIKISVSRSLSTGYRHKGLGRPTKKERRTIDKWQDGQTII